LKSIQSIFITGILTIFFVNIALAQGPSQKTVSKRPPSNSALSKVYHNVTAKYNGYFNAELKLNEGKKKLSDQYTDNYNLILDMYKFMAVPDAKSVSPDMDIAITKAAVDIKLHSRSLFVDDCYLLIGQAQYVKRDFEASEKTFDFIVTAFDPKNPNNPMKKATNSKEKKKQREATAKEKKKQREADKKARAKERELIREAKKKAREAKKKGNKDATYEDFMPKPKAKDEKNKEKKPSKFKHRPIRKDAMLWLARTQIERGKFDEAKVWLSRLQADDKLPKSLKAELSEVNAYYYLKQKQYESAITPLEDAITLSKKRKKKARYAFILAQIHQKAGRQAAAAASFERVIKYRPSYEMEFSARLSMIKNTLEGDAIALANAEKALKKLLKDEKNEEYQDQIYYALADIAFKGDEDTKAVAYLKKSIYFNFGNTSQKSESYLKLANTFYKKENYVDAKYYYDSTLTTIAKNDDRYDVVEFRSKSLTDIATNIQIITKQDSFLRIKSLIDGDQEKEYMLIAQKIKENEEKAKAAKTTKKPKLTARRALEGVGVNQAGRGGKNKVPKFWAYESNLDKGKREFRKIWGADRRLSDDWRRSKRSNPGGDLDFVEGEVEEVFDLTKDEALAIFKRIGVPSDDAAAALASNKTMDAMASLGTLYRERLNNLPKSIEILEQLIQRFPKTKYRLESLYALHIEHKQLKNTQKANDYRALILTEARNSKFAKAIEDPNFLASEKDKETQLQDYYNVAYKDFQAGKFKDARNQLDGVESKFGKDFQMKSKFALLGAMCTGAIDGSDAYKQGLKEVASKYKTSDEGKKAQEILDILGGKKIKPKVAAGGSSSSDSDDEEIKIDEKSGFTINNKSQHFIMVVYDSKKIKQTDAVASVADYNKKYHRLKRLRVSNFLISIETPTILIRRFSNRKDAMTYVVQVNNAKEEFLSVEDPSFKIISINQTNYKTVLRDRSKWGDYLEFFDRIYMK
jgi:tetratricopeptide (TPR) repeat protein